MSDPILSKLVPLFLAASLVACASKQPVGPTASEVPGPWEHAFVELEDRGDDGPLRMHYLAAGPKDAPRVVLLHGFPDMAYGWRGVIPLLAEDHRVLAPDLRGYGATDRPESGYGVRELADDIAAFIPATAEADGLPADTPVHLVTHDWGSAVGWVFVMGSPQGVLSFTATSVPHPAAWAQFLEEDEPQRRRATYQKQLAQPGVAGLLGGFSTRQVGELYRSDLVDENVFTDEHLAVYRAAMKTSADWLPPLRYYQRQWQDREELAAHAAAAAPVALPVLLVWGEQDGYLYSRQAPMTCEHVAPGPCEVEVFDDAGHFVQWDVPNKYVARWRQFVTALPSP
jgi:epoxide hydrolase 4